MAGDPYKYFRLEARELLQQLGRGALELERGEPAADHVARLLRLAHTLKGAARVVKQREMADLTHAIEDALEPYRAHAGPVPRPTIEILRALCDQLGARVVALDESAPAAVTPVSPDPSAPAPAGVLTTAVAATAAEIAPRTLRADVTEVDELLEGIAEAHGQLGALRRTLGPLERARRLAEVLIEQLGSIHQARGATAQKTRSLAEELGTLVGGIEQSLGRGIEQVDRELRQVRQSGQRLRLLPAAAMVDTLERLARDAAENLGRRMVFESQGADVRLDADVLASVQTALVQVVRNAVAHGIEPEAERAAAGKPLAGKVRLEIDRRANRVVFRCTDDGRGIDLPAVRRAAARGLSDIEASRLADDEVVRLLLKGGISTSRTVTAMAGRGVGLDVVREVAERLGGRVGVKTEAGRGMTLELAVPISLSSLDALVVDAEDRTAAIPLEAIRQILRLNPHDVARAGDSESIVFAGQAIPFAPLAAMLRASSGGDATARAWSAVVVESPSGRAALGVTRLRGTETVVVQPLPEAVAADPVVAGAALDAEGNPLLVLYTDALVAAAARTGARERPAPRQRPPVLIVDDSLTTRMLEQSILELAGYDVDMATSGEEALEKAAARRYALFLVDVEMPGMDGFTFVATTQKDPTLRNVPAILITSRDAEEDRARGRAVGAKAYIVKSELDQNDLLERIGKLVA